MSAITTKPRCVTCGKEISVLKCESCFQAAWYSLTVIHGQKPDRQSDEGKVNQQTANAQQQQHAWIQQVDDWECNAINQIRQTADDARQLILKHTTERVSEVETKLFKLADQLRQCRQENNFASKNVCQWQEELAQLSKQLLTPSRITVRQVFTPLVSRIHVDIPGKDANHSEKWDLQ